MRAARKPESPDPGCRHAITLGFYVAVSFGFLTACTDASTEPEPAPDPGERSIRIRSPGDGAFVERGDPVVLSSSLEGGPLGPGQFVSWDSDVQGHVAIGDSVQVTHLLPGEHLLTAAVRRFDLRLASDSVQVTVADRTSHGIRVLGRLDPGGGGFADLWLENDLLALGTRFRGQVFLIDVSVPTAPRLVGTVSTAGGGQDVQLSGGHLFLETGEVFDVRDPANPEAVSRVPVAAYDVFVGGGRFYSSFGGGTPGSGLPDVAGECPAVFFGRGVDIFDVSRPEGPVRLGEFTEKGVAHELQEHAGILYGAFCGGFCAVDVIDPGQPRLLGCGFRGTHSVFRHPSRPIAFTTDESAFGNVDPTVQIWDVSSPGSPRLIAGYQSIPGSADHQIWAEGDWLAVAGYAKGVEVVDVSEPARPRLIGFYDTFQQTGGTFDGVWGVVLTPQGIVYAADTATGLWILEVD